MYCACILPDTRLVVKRFFHPTRIARITNQSGIVITSLLVEFRGTQSSCGNEVRAVLVGSDPGFALSEQCAVFSVLIRVLDPGCPVVHLLTAEALIASHKGLTGQFQTGAVDRLFVVVVRHVILL